MSFFARPIFNRIKQVAFKPRGVEEFFEGGKSLPTEKSWTGRAWRASELRLKSFDDLHKLWYVLLKERNLLATQKEEARRFHISKQFFSNKGRQEKCKKSMARIKFVLNERRLAWVEAKKLQRLANVEEASVNTKVPTTGSAKVASENTTSAAAAGTSSTSTSTTASTTTNARA
ncbi:mitochondrial 39-S ribosomal protein L47 (MRP-L47)-domain-containing protein [Lobosporangium transversale]|uniref:Large ribosomal subunit protein uL29m n=1 Tax=Lobosporangium transversale TaxID=64571 RepID=A0A1Y2GNQ3_9FUNG|nr:mitochondrial 39-S ribosomal protein L47 (MRP-L47)-domain-containing protein [Lobosporangium transversale]ORZ14997.1 mitochondrial 39-S ribosomal protein L47 (MRP-L47)-domain-containing protein [Lobosporangium transversale]|eukprot:XP_021881129.1 mitochondrial 39-S ribosomal protein L47 (MRP-L47)-domain-containing protein [Lobosporangium transversale]